MSTMATIVCAVNFSDHSKVALGQAVAFIFVILASGSCAWVQLSDRHRESRAIRTSPPRASDAALRVDALEVANQQQPGLDPRRQAGPAHRFGVERGALSFCEVVELMLARQLIQSRIERVAGGGREIRPCHPHRRLSIACAFAHRHGQSLVPKIDESIC